MTINDLIQFLKNEKLAKLYIFFSIDVKIVGIRQVEIRLALMYLKMKVSSKNKRVFLSFNQPEMNIRSYYLSVKTDM